MQITIDTNDSTPAEMYAAATLLMGVADELAAALVPSTDAVAPPLDLTSARDELGQHHPALREPTAAEIFGAQPAPARTLEARPHEQASTTPPPPPTALNADDENANDDQRGATQGGAIPPTAPDVDASGAPFDPVIHSSAHKKNADGLWKKRRGGPPAPPAAPVIPPPPTIPPPPGAVSPFRALAGRVGAAVEAGKITREQVREICVSVGSPDLMTLNALPHLIPSADAVFTAAGC